MTTSEAKSAAPPASRPAVGTEVPFAPILTLVLWLGCLLVGTLGFVLPYARPRPAAPPAPPVQAELIKVELTNQPASPPVAIAPSPEPAQQPPPLFAPAAPPPAPQFVAVALPSPAIAFALPVEAPARLLEVKQAAFVRAAPPSAPPAAPAAPSGIGTGQRSTGVAPAPVVQTLTYGEGEGRQPAPEYPLAARRAGQEGTVVIRFSVGADGRVLAAEPASPSPWGALNREALRVVREQWRFKPGPVRLFEVAIRFQLTK